MATLREYFDRDFARDFTANKAWTLRADSEVIETPARVHLDFVSGSKYVSFFIPRCAEPLLVCLHLIRETSELLASAGVIVESGYVGEGRLSSDELEFSGSVYFYVESGLTDPQVVQLAEAAHEQDVIARYRGPEFSAARSALEHPVAFISHDSRDKDTVARPIAVGLQKLMQPVWFDEFSLKVGDPLRESIERGLKDCRKCILILSPSFLTNGGWTKVEFNSIFTREIVEQKQLVLPVWHGVSRQQVFEYSPSLADRVALHWLEGEDSVVRKLYHALTSASTA